LAVAFSVTESAMISDAATVMTLGGAAGVVKDNTAPSVVPIELWAIAQK
jgi:hypothetical protein